MYISSLKIERFGVWADVRLNSFSEGLNVIYGPNGSGKTTVVRFISATLYGFGDDVRSRYLPAGVNGGGSLTVQGPFGRRTILRHDEGPSRDRLLIENADAAVGGLYQLQDLLGGVRQAAFDRLFHVEFQGDLDADKLIQAALAEGFDLIGGHADAEHVAELQDRLQSKRQALAEITTADIAAAMSLEALHANLKPYDVRLHEARGRPSASAVARAMAAYPPRVALSSASTRRPRGASMSSAAGIMGATSSRPSETAATNHVSS